MKKTFSVRALVIIGVVTVGIAGGVGVSLGQGDGAVSTGNEVSLPTGSPMPAVEAPAGQPVDDARVTPPDAAFPRARPRPSLVDAQNRAGHEVDVNALLARAGTVTSISNRTSTFGQIPSTALVDLVWGDVENYESGTETVDPNTVVIRFAKLLSKADARYFEIAAVDVSTGQPLTMTTSMLEGTGRPDGFTVNLPGTRWAD